MTAIKDRNEHQEFRAAASDPTHLPIQLSCLSRSALPTPSFYLSIYPPAAKHPGFMMKPPAYRFIAYPLFSQIIVRYPGPIHAQLVVHGPKCAYRAPEERQLEGVGQVNDFVNRVFIQI
jgi:hypothetical protein